VACAPAPRSSALIQKAVLVALAVKAGPDGSVVIYSAESLRDLVDACRSSISRALTALERAGLFSRVGRSISLPIPLAGVASGHSDRGQRPQVDRPDRVASGHSDCGQRLQNCGQRPPLLNKQKPLSIIKVEEAPTVIARDSSAVQRLLKAERDYCRQSRSAGDASIERGIADLGGRYSEIQISLAVSEVASRAEAAFKRGRPWALIQIRYILDTLQAKRGQAAPTPDPDISARKEEERMRRVLEELRSGVKYEAHR
jgi:hypothetical protein